MGTELGRGRGSRLAAALTAAFKTVVKGGLIPHARHGGKWVVGFAVAGSKFEGTGFEKVQMGQIHVEFTGVEVDFCGAINGGRVEPGLPELGYRVDVGGTAGLDVALRDLSVLLFCGLGYIVIFGDDFKKPAFAYIHHVSQAIAYLGVGEGSFKPDIQHDQFPSNRSPPSTFEDHLSLHSIPDGMLSRHGHPDNRGSCIS